MEKLINSVGNPVEGEDRFWGRENEILGFIELLSSGAHVYITAQRRIGKTSLIREVIRRIKENHICLELDLQSCHTPADVIVDLAAQTRPYMGLWKKTKEVFKNTFREATEKVESLSISEIQIKLRGAISGDWQIKGDHLFEALAQSSNPVIIFMDELPIFIGRLLKGENDSINEDDRTSADTFLSWLRANAQKYAGKICIVVSGSIGLEPLLRRARLSGTINYLTPFELPPWDSATALGCLHALGKQYNLVFDQGVGEHMIELIGFCVPHHVQMYFHFANHFCKRQNNMAFSKENANMVYNEHMLGPRGHSELNHYEERLTQVLGKSKATLAFELLTAASKDNNLSPDMIAGISKDYEGEFADLKATLVEIIGVFEHDGYLRLNSAGNYVFVSKLLRDWWRRRFGADFLKSI